MPRVFRSSLVLFQALMHPLYISTPLPAVVGWFITDNLSHDFLAFSVKRSSHTEWLRRTPRPYPPELQSRPLPSIDRAPQGIQGSRPLGEAMSEGRTTIPSPNACPGRLQPQSEIDEVHLASELHRR